jgi:hypothetical protein
MNRCSVKKISLLPYFYVYDSLDPSSLKCVVCSNSHYVLAKGPEDSPPIIIFADQNFVPMLTGGKSCLAIVRLEDASIPELTDLAFEILDKYHPPARTIFLFGSSSHLLNAGTTIYTQEWCNLVSNLSSTYPDSRILPLTPVIREDCPGVVSRQLIELATWYKTVYANDIMGITSVWDTLVSTLCKTDEDGLDLGYDEIYSVAMPAFLAPNAPLRNHKFKTNSSHTTTIGFDSVASKELLASLINKFKCTFATAAHSEDILLEALAELESKLEKKTVYIFGGSNMRSVIPELEKNGFHVIDHTVLGWVPTAANISKISEVIAHAQPLDIVVADLLGNVMHRYAQADGTLAMPFKNDGKYHYEGEIKVCTLSNLKSIIESLIPALSRCRCHLVFTPPLPRHLHNGCCSSAEHCTNVGSEKHAEKMLASLNAIRTACVSNLETLGVKDFTVPDILKLSMPACASISEYAEALKTHMKKDGVHFTASGYSCLASDLSKHLRTLTPEKSLPPASLFQTPRRTGSSRSTGAALCRQWALRDPSTTGLHTCNPTQRLALPKHGRGEMEGKYLLPLRPVNEPVFQKRPRPHALHAPGWAGWAGWKMIANEWLANCKIKLNHFFFSFTNPRSICLMLQIRKFTFLSMRKCRVELLSSLPARRNDGFSWL